MLTVPSAGSADVWWLDITSVNVGRAELAELSLEEHKRAAAFAFRADRRRYTAAHVMLRRVLSGYLDFPPSSLVFHREPCPRCGKQTGRPALPLRFGVHFSLAHSGDAVLIAVAAQQVGVDVEQQPTGCVCTMSADMNTADAEWGRSLSESGRHELVIRWWVRSEAVLKCTGEGLGRARLLADLAPGARRLPGRARAGRQCPRHPAQCPGAMDARGARGQPGR